MVVYSFNTLKQTKYLTNQKKKLEQTNFLLFGQKANKNWNKVQQQKNPKTKYIQKVPIKAALLLYLWFFWLD